MLLILHISSSLISSFRCRTEIRYLFVVMMVDLDGLTFFFIRYYQVVDNIEGNSSCEIEATPITFRVLVKRDAQGNIWT